ncbi:hypothetical protein MJK72_19850 [Klebsiella pneumoniae]|nr:hypothetical protein MJK72_19850 [Klebsiella pneumoniae]
MAEKDRLSAVGILLQERHQIDVRIKCRFRRVHFAQGRLNIPVGDLQIRAARRQLIAEGYLAAARCDRWQAGGV